MDLSFIQEQLDTFATFAGAIGDFLQKPVEFFQNLVEWFSPSETDPDKSNFQTDWADTSSALGSSNETESGEEATSFLSSSDKEAE